MKLQRVIAALRRHPDNEDLAELVAGILRRLPALGIENDLCAVYDFKEVIAAELRLSKAIFEDLWDVPLVHRTLIDHGYRLASNEVTAPETRIRSRSAKATGKRTAPEGAAAAVVAPKRVRWQDEARRYGPGAEQTLERLHRTLQVVIGLLVFLLVFFACLPLTHDARVARTLQRGADAALSASETLLRVAYPTLRDYATQVMRFAPAFIANWTNGSLVEDLPVADVLHANYFEVRLDEEGPL